MYNVSQGHIESTLVWHNSYPVDTDIWLTQGKLVDIVMLLGRFSMAHLMPISLANGIEVKYVFRCIFLGGLLTKYHRLFTIRKTM